LDHPLYQNAAASTLGATGGDGGVPGSDGFTVAEAELPCESARPRRVPAWHMT